MIVVNVLQIRPFRGSYSIGMVDATKDSTKKGEKIEMFHTFISFFFFCKSIFVQLKCTFITPYHYTHVDGALRISYFQKVTLLTCIL